MSKDDFVWFAYWQIPLVLIVANVCRYALETSLNVSMFIAGLFYIITVFCTAGFYRKWNT